MNQKHLDYHDHEHASVKRRGYTFLSPIIFSLGIILNAHGQNTYLSDTALLKPQLEDVVSTPEITAGFEHSLNEITKYWIPQTKREKLIQEFLTKLQFIFEIPQDNIYFKKNTVITKANIFLNSFYKESYRESNKLKVVIKSIYQQNNKLYIDIEYLYTADRKND